MITEMTQVISSKNQFGNQAWRRHTDPPGLWISVVIASVLLHLFGIWLIRFSGSNFSSQQDSASVIPITFVEVAPVQKTTKSVVNRKSPVKKSPVSSIKPVIRNNYDRKITPKSTVGNGIALTDNTTKKKVTPKKRSRNASKPTTQKTGVPRNPVKKQVTQSNKTQRGTRQNTPANSNTPTKNQQQPPTNSNTPTKNQQQPPVNSNTPTKNQQQPPVNSNTPAKNQQQPPVNSNTPAKNQQQPPVNSNTPAKNQQQPPVNSNTPSNNTETNQPWNRSRGDIELGTGQRLGSNPLLPSNQSSSSANNQAGLFLVRVNPLSRQAVLAGKFRFTPPDVMAKYTGNQESILDISIQDKYLGLKTAKLLVSLVIDKNGKFEQALVLNITPQKLAVNKLQYQKFLNEHFRNQKFIPASNNNGTKPDVSNLILNIAIENNLPGSMVENK